MLPTEVFLSHSDQDRQFATDLAEMMRYHGIPVWYSRTNILGAQQWHDEIGAALRRCDWFVLALSPRSVESIWVKREFPVRTPAESFYRQNCTYPLRTMRSDFVS